MRIQFSKEFECILDPGQVEIDRDGKGVDAFLSMMANRFGFSYEAGSEKIDVRQVCKYDTQDGFLNSNGIHAKFIAYQKRGKPTAKLALKSLSQLPELVEDQLEHRKRNLVYPARPYHDQSRLKVEQDLVGTYSQFGISGTIWAEGKHEWSTLGDIAEYFPNLRKMKGYAAPTPVVEKGAHELTLIDDLAIAVPTKKGDTPIDASLELRYSGNKLNLVEMSLRAIKPSKGEWNRHLLAELTRIYSRLQQSDMVVPEDDYYRFYAFPLLSS